MGFTLEVDNYRALRKVRWSPSGVCAVTGPNGSGKTTLLSVLEFLRHYLQRGVQGAVDFSGGTAGLLHQGAAVNEPILMKLSHGGCTWQTLSMPSPPGLNIQESVFAGDTLLAESNMPERVRPPFGIPVTSTTLPALARALALYDDDEEVSQPLHELFGLTADFRLYQEFDLRALRTTGSPVSADPVPPLQRKQHLLPAAQLEGGPARGRGPLQLRPPGAA